MGTARLTDRLFFAIVPDPKTAARIADLGRVLRKTHRLQGKAVVPEQLHITLWHVGDDFFAPPPELISTLVRRAGYVEMPSFRISFDHVMSFRNGAFVLCGEEGAAGLEMLHERLQAVLAPPGRRQRRSAFTPHMTLLRDERRLPLQPVEPIEWTAREVVLVHSLLGRTSHRHLAHLPLA